MYDIRSSRPMLVKDHRFELPIKQIEWHKDNDMILSIDKRSCKIWDRHTVRNLNISFQGLNLIYSIYRENHLLLLNQEQV